MKPVTRNLWLGMMGLVGILVGCGPSQPAVATYQASVTNTSPQKAVEDRQRVAQLFAELAAPRGLVKEARFPASEGTVYFPGATGLNLSLSALKLDERTLAITLTPVMQGRKDDQACRAVMAAVAQELQKHFGARLVQSP